MQPSYTENCWKSIFFCFRGRWSVAELQSWWLKGATVASAGGGRREGWGTSHQGTEGGTQTTQGGERRGEKESSRQTETSG